MNAQSIILPIIFIILLGWLFSRMFNNNNTIQSGIVRGQGIILTIIIIIFLFWLFRHIFKDVNTLQSGIVSGQLASTIDASSLSTNNNSNNFAYSIWFYVNDWNYRYGEPKVVFGRMGSLSTSGGGSIDNVNGVDPCPAVVLGALENNISVAVGCYPGMDTVPTSKNGKSVVHTCNIANVPIQKWVNLVLSVYGRTLDLYIDGKLVRTCIMPGIAMVNTNSNIYVTPKGGFNGWTSKLQYWSNALNPQEVWNNYTKGYGNTAFGNLFGNYTVSLTLEENGVEVSNTTI